MKLQLDFINVKNASIRGGSTNNDFSNSWLRHSFRKIMIEQMDIKKKHPNYFEGILQLRSPNEELVDYVKKTTLEDNRAVIVKQKPVNGGVDLYFSSQKYVQIIGKKIKERFPGILKTSATLHTQKKGKRLYRVTVLFKHVPIKKSQALRLKGEDYIVLGWGRKVLIKHDKSGKKREISFEEVLI